MIMKPSILKHCSGRNYNSPFRQENKERSFGANLNIDKEQKTISPSLSAASGNLSANAGANISPTSKSYNAGIGFNKGGFHAGVGISGANKSKPNVTANLGYSKNF
jgi:hypothetical protein